VLAQPRLPRRIELDVRVIVEGERDLARLAAGQIEEVLVERSPVGSDHAGIGDAGYVLAARALEREKVADPLLGSRSLGTQGR
jgi:hypothetical protein